MVKHPAILVLLRFCQSSRQVEYAFGVGLKVVNSFYGIHVERAIEMWKVLIVRNRIFLRRRVHRRFPFERRFQACSVYSEQCQSMLPCIKGIGNPDDLIEARKVDKTFPRETLGAVFAASTGFQRGVTGGDVQNRLAHGKTW